MIKFEDTDIFLVTGASNGIGRAISCLIIELGGKVVGIGRNTEKLAELTNLFPNSFWGEAKDISQDIESLPNFVSELAKKYGKFRGTVLSAGIQETRPVSILKLETLNQMMNTNLMSNLFIIKGFSKKINRVEGDTSIVAISSLASEKGIQGIVGYSASKGGLNSSVKALAVELAKDKIRINAVLPGHIVTDMLTADNKFYSEEYIQKLQAKYPLGLGRPEDVAQLTCFLLSNASRWITGSCYNIDGGASVSF